MRFAARNRSWVKRAGTASAAAALAAWLAVPSADAATTLVRMSLEEMGRAATAVVRASCVAKSSQREGNGIWTFTEFEVLETLKGRPPSRIRVRLPGGRAGQVVSRVEGAPVFRPGEEVVLFLERSSGGEFTVISWAQGTFRITHDPHTRERVVTQDASGLAVYDPATRRFHTGGVHSLPLDQFRQRLARALAAPEQRPR